MEKTLAIVDVTVLEHALTALRYAAEDFEELGELDDAAMMESRADDLAAAIRIIKGGR